MQDWQFAHLSNKQIYEVAINEEVVTLMSIKEATQADFGAVKQLASALPLRQKRIRFKALISCDNAMGAGLWITASSTDWHVTDGMYDRLLTGTCDWQEQELIIDVPAQTTYVSYGMWLKGEGKCQLKEPSFDVVTDEAIVTTSDKIWDRVGVDAWQERD